MLLLLLLLHGGSGSCHFSLTLLEDLLEERIMRQRAESRETAVLRMMGRRMRMRNGMMRIQRMRWMIGSRRKWETSHGLLGEMLLLIVLRIARQVSGGSEIIGRWRAAAATTMMLMILFLFLSG